MDQSKYEVFSSPEFKIVPRKQKAAPSPRASCVSLARPGPATLTRNARNVRARRYSLLSPSWPEPEFLRCEWSSQCRKCPQPSGSQSQAGSRQEKTSGHHLPQCSNQRS